MSTNNFHHAAIIGKTSINNQISTAEIRNYSAVLRQIIDCIKNTNAKVSIESNTAINLALTDLPTLPMPELAETCDVAIVVGGDGTMLNAARQLANLNVQLPLIGVHQGRLGFMVDITMENLQVALPAMLKGQYIKDIRHLMRAQIINDKKIQFDSLALNDVAIHRGCISGIIELRVEVDGHFVCTQRADGIVVSSATGSSAYALSAGGALMHPTVSGWIIVPVAPHRLSSRPIVLNDNSTVQLEVLGYRPATVSCDAQEHGELTANSHVLIRRAKQTVCLLHPKGWSYFDTLREKLHWNKEGSS